MNYFAMHIRSIDSKIEQLKKRMEEIEDLLDDLRNTRFDTLTLSGPEGKKSYPLDGADQIYRFKIDSIERGTIVFSVDKSIVHCNRHFAEMLGMPVDRILGASISTLVRKSDRQRLLDLIRQAYKHELVREEISFLTASGTESFHITMGLLNYDNLQLVCMAATPKARHKHPHPKVSEEAPEKPAESGIRVLLVDDHAVMRQGLSMLLSDYPDIEVAGEAANGKDAIDLARRLEPDVILMDISMPDMNGIEATRIIHRELPGIIIIGLSMFDAEDQEAAIKKAGASHYLKKSGKKKDLLRAIRNTVESHRE